MRRFLLPLVALCVFSGAFGLWMGLRFEEPSETDIINGHAARYVNETGGALSDCYAVPGTQAGIRLVVICAPEGAAWVQPVDRWGRPMAVELSQEDGT